MSDLDLKPRILTGLPTGNKGRPRADMRPELIDAFLDSKGYLVWWSRAAVCPCRQNDQTEQPKLTCPLCKGSGWHFYLPEVGLQNCAEDADGNPIEINAAGDAVLISAVMTQATQDPQVYERFGGFIFGTFRATVHSRNRLGYRDRLVMSESLMMFGQLLQADGSARISVKTAAAGQKALWYPVVSVNLLRSESRVYAEGSDWQLDLADGSIKWSITPPAAGTILTCNYEIHPVYRVMDHVHAVRDTNVAKKAKTKQEQHRMLPVNAMVKLDFLLGGGGE
ncbi:MAG: hypothetical protein MUC88_00025 [Planctomycetes bacterium]|jgi:hypothetical protein|nr:hypothetical protein [Planctomycetota bacterium]